MSGADLPELDLPAFHLPAFHLAVYSDAQERGGAEVTLTHLLGGLPDQVRVSVVGVDPDVVGWLAGCRPGSAQVALDPIRSRSDVSAMLAHLRAFRSLRADIVQFNLSMASSCQWAILAATLTRQKTLLVENSSMGTWSGTSTRLKRLNSRAAAAHVAVGERTARIIEADSGLRPDSVRTMYHGVPDVARHPRSDQRGTTLLNIARHDPVKGIDVLLHAMTSLPDDVTLTQMGRGPESDRLVALAAELGLGDRVEFVELSWQERAADRIGAHDVFVLPSRVEGLPVTIMEAMLAGTAIVATDVGSVSEQLTDGDTGLVVAPEDPEALAAAIARLLDDAPLRARLGAAARARALERFTVESTVERYCELYRRILSGDPR